MQRHPTFGILACFLASACGGPARPKLMKIEETFRSTSGSSVDRTDIDYNTGELLELN